MDEATREENRDLASLGATADDRATLHAILRTLADQQAALLRLFEVREKTAQAEQVLGQVHAEIRAAQQRSEQLQEALAAQAQPKES